MKDLDVMPVGFDCESVCCEFEPGCILMPGQTGCAYRKLFTGGEDAELLEDFQEED